MKRWYRSKTVGANVAIVGLAAWCRTSAIYVDPFVFIVAMAVLNLGLRGVSRDRITWR